jgi:glyoxylase-like metal-dependent hydrolase (beta-lactamase superfamily II)
VSVRIERVVTHGEFHLDGETFAVENNVWLVGDEREVLVIDAAHSASAIVAALADRRLVGIVCTHAHDDHINVAPELSDQTAAPVLLNFADAVLWQQTHQDRLPDRPLADEEVLTVAGISLHVLHTPGHAPGAVCLFAPELSALFSGDTLFAGGPGATGRSFSDFGTIIDSIRERLLTLPPGTVVHPGHGEDTTIGAEAPHLKEWIARGH